MTKALAFFGAFNPPTIAHVSLAEFALRAAGREQVIFVPSKSVYIRDEEEKVSSEDAMVRAIRDCPCSRAVSPERKNKDEDETRNMPRACGVVRRR